MSAQSLSGNLTGLKPSQVQALERLSRRRIPPSRVVTVELAAAMAQLSREIGRQVGALVSRTGHVDFVTVGDASRVHVPDFGRLRTAQRRFRGLRLLHTHLHDEKLTRDDLVDLVRLRLDLVAAICVSPQGGAGNVYYAHLMPKKGAGGPPWHTEGPTPIHKLDVSFVDLMRSLEQEYEREGDEARPVEAAERAVLVHVAPKGKGQLGEDSLAELKRLARTAGVEVAEEVLQHRERPDPRYVMGRGKLEDVVLVAMSQDAELLIFDQELRPAQARAIGDVTDLKVIDRTQLILDIFAQHAHTQDGKLQVELAQLRYRLPRLGKLDDALSRLTGGIGGRGPGETKLEIGRRRTRERIARLEKSIDRLARQREQKRRRRSRTGVPVLAIVGYTNAGKSTLINTLAHADVLVEDKLFATLETTARRLRLPSSRQALLVDTVGFIRQLPRDLLTAFRATLEELHEATLLLHVIDGSDRASGEHVRTVENVLADLGLHEIPRLRLLNKTDLLTPAAAAALGRRHDALPVCAHDRSSLEPLLREVDLVLGHGLRARGEPS